MKKFLTMGALALALTAVYSAPAPAWLNWKFGIGMNLGWQSGGNNTLWGLFRNGQPPGPDCGMGGGCGLPPIGGYGGGFQPNNFSGPTNTDAAAAPRAVPQSYQSYQQQAPWSNYYSNTNTVGYRYQYYPYYNYGYGYNYNR